MMGHHPAGRGPTQARLWQLRGRSPPRGNRRSVPCILVTTPRARTRAARVAAVLALGALVAAGPGAALPAAGGLMRPAVAPAPEAACPVVAVPRVAASPDPAPPPGRDPSRPVIGGAALGTSGLVVPLGAPPVPDNLSAKAWLVADLDSGDVLGGCGPHRHLAPASVQKLLLAAAVLPRLDPAQVVEVTQADLDFEPGSSAMGLLPGGRYAVETLWLGLLLNSGNDAANVLARLGGGADGLAGGIAAMNAEARRLGAYETHAVTASGLDGAGQFTSAYDLALIARADFARQDFRRYVATQRAQVPAQPPRDPRGFQIQNDNQLLSEYPGALGGKTGFTDVARHTYVGAAERGGRRLVVTLLGAESRPVRSWQQAAALLDWGFGLPPGEAVGRLVEPGEVGRLVPTPADGGRDGAVPALRGTSGWTFATTVAGGVALTAGASLVGLRWRVLRRRRRRRSGVRGRP